MGAAGGLGAPRPDQHYEPPAGGQAVAGQRGVIRARTVIVFGSGPGAGVFVYSPSPGLGKLIASITAANSTDPFGNATVSGFTSYRQVLGTFYAYQVGLAASSTLGITLFSAPAAAGPYSSLGQLMDFDPSTGGFTSTNIPWNVQNAIVTLSETGGAQLLILRAFASAARALLQLDGFTAADTVLGADVGGDLQYRFTIAANGLLSWGLGASAPDVTLGRTTTAAGGLVENVNSNAAALRIIQALAGPSNPIFIIEAGAAGDNSVRINVTGDANARLAIDSNGAIKWGNGTNAVDTRLYRGAAGELAADFIAANNGGAAEIWNDLGAVGQPAFANGWANAATGAAAAFRLVAAPYNSMQWVGRLTAPAGIAAGQAINAAVPAAYRPAHAQSVAGVDITTGALVRFQMGVTGLLTYQSGSAAGDTIDIFDGLVSLEA